ncbi:type II toxin-antitoxin system RelE/ParE family toxin [Rhizobium halophytocola]|uniref:Plasmid stabilization system protein ParE n=1 Tax=Rhizobium halophytocola TaxID=735519 RepID=A0ABS4DX47_9HYPH|nr:type II toxin-antitoxin system RelE/ParE family toxin [Rhizobium halophytocola]MBP1850242.1 plasmid stabilization system protein ParE [Rhizobium halophytocola]
MKYTLRYTQTALNDFDRLYDYLIMYDLDLAARAYEAIAPAISQLEHFPFSHRKAPGDDALLRELLVPFGSSGFVVLYRIDGADVISVLAVRHQREDDYH